MTVGSVLRCPGEHANTVAMSRFFGPATIAALAFTSVQGAWAQDSQTLEEVRTLRSMVEKQSKQIDGLSEQIVKLRIALEKAGEVPLGSAAPTPAAAPAAPSVSTPTAPVASAPAEFSTDNIPKAEAADGKRHVVIKGETLTSIAKHYSITISELKKANKEVDERKMQIGQTLTIPAPKTPEVPADKKENP